MSTGAVSTGAGSTDVGRTEPSSAAKAPAAGDADGERRYDRERPNVLIERGERRGNVRRLDADVVADAADAAFQSSDRRRGVASVERVRQAAYHLAALSALSPTGSPGPDRLRSRGLRIF